jgi:peptide chain release factor 2
MNENLRQKNELLLRFEKIKSELKIEQKRHEKTVLEKELSRPELWRDQQKSQKVVAKLKAIKEILDSIDLLEKLFADQSASFEQIKNLLNQLEIKMLFSNKYDHNQAYMTISAGTGGTDAQDWAAILLRMYLKFSDKMAWKSQILAKNPGEEAGIKNVSLHITGDMAYGYLKAEAGVHRLVRKSPFNAKSLRQTSFTLVDVTPEINNPQVEIKDEDLKIETFRSRGAGGQSVNTTDSAVRITHLPTKISVSCQNERSQLQNKETALKILKSKLAQLGDEKHLEELDKARGEVKTAKWGNQIRSYVFDPYKLVKDHRTDYEETNVNKVLDGEIKNFIIKFLRKEENVRSSQRAISSSE